MKAFAPLLLVSALLLIGCAPVPRLTLQQIQPKHVVKLSKTEVFETVRMFSVKEGFRIDSFEEESGRIIGHRTHQATPSSDAGKMIIMNLRILPADSTHSEVNAGFTFSSAGEVLNREQEEMLVECYTTLYDYLDRRAQ
jgi:hypothetical protein